VFVEDADIERLAVIRPQARRAPPARDLAFALREPSIRHFAFSFAALARWSARASSADILLLTTSVVMVNN
jgi:hypothetical protein